MVYNDYYAGRMEELRRLMGATDIQVDLTGVTLTINGKETFFPQIVIRAMTTLLQKAEEDAVSEARSRQEADKAGASPS